MFPPRLRILRKSRTFAKFAKKKASDFKAGDPSKQLENPVDLITNAGARSNWQLALQFWTSLRGGSTVTADATIRALGRGMQWEQSTTFLREEIISPASHASTLRIVAEATAWMHCLEILSTMQLRRVHLSTASLNTTLVSCGRRFMWQAALNLLVTHLPSSIPSSKHHSETNDCNLSILTALQVAHQWEQALQLYANSDLEDASHMTMVMEACKRSYAWEAALTLLADRPLHHGGVHMAMRTCAASSEWEATLSLLQLEPKHVSTALSALAKSMQWERGIQLFYENIQSAKPSTNSGNLKKVGHGESDLDPTTYRSLLRVLGGGSHWRSALQFLEILQKPHEDPWTLSAAVWACQAAGQEEAAQQLLTKSLMLKKRRKELDLLEHLTQFGHQTAAELLTLIENYAHEHRWLKVAGGEKAQILETHIKPGDRVLELGTYIGFTSLRLAAHGCQVISIEADPLNAAVAQKILSMTSETSGVKMCVGRASDWLSCGLLEPVDVLLLDHRGTIYHEDLAMAERLLRPGARVIADNVLHPGAPLFVNDVKERYDLEVHVLEEFGMSNLEDWLFICKPKMEKMAAMPRRPSSSCANLRQWTVEVNRLCHESKMSHVDWQEFQTRLKPVLLEMLQSAQVEYHYHKKVMFNDATVKKVMC